MLPTSALDLRKAKVEVALAAADVAEAEVRAARAQLDLAVARLELLQANEDQGESPKPSPHGSPRGTEALQSSPSPTLVDGEPAAMVVAVPSHKPDAHKLFSASLGPGSPGFRAVFGETRELDGSAWLARASIPLSPSPPAADLRGPFMEFGEVRIRYWYVCWAGGEPPCGIMTTDEQFKYDWNVIPVRKQCCAKDGHVYRHTWKPIMQICALDEEFLIRMDAPTWDTDQLMYHGILKEAENARLSAFIVYNAIRDVRKCKFESVFSPAQKDQTKPCVDLEKTTWLFNPNTGLPEWDFELLYGVVKH
jgi:hypothetical protein